MKDKSWIEDLRGEFDPSRVIETKEELLKHSYDSWPVAAKWRQQQKTPFRPDVIFKPHSAEEISRLLVWANRQGVPVTARGAGSGVTGAALPIQGGISLDMSAMDRLLILDETNLIVRVEAGKMGYELERELRARGYTLNHSPQSLERSTAGGWVATRATGQFSSRWGGIEDLLVSLRVVLPDGEIVETRMIPRAAVGPDLRELFVGSEGTLGIICDVTLKIFPKAETRLYETFMFPELENGLEAMRKVVQSGLRPFLVRLYDMDEASHLLGQPAPGGILLIGFEGLEQVVRAEFQAGLTICASSGGKAYGPQPALNWMERRFDFSTVERILDEPGGVAETIEVVHFWSDIYATYRALKQNLKPYVDEVWGHFSHVYYQGTSLYMILLGEAPDAAAAEQRLLSIWNVAMRTCLERRAGISHHHGVGLARAAYVQKDLGNQHYLLAKVKAALDPNSILNPGKLDLQPVNSEK